MSHFLTSRIMNDVLGGLTQGVIIGLVALSLVLIWRATHVLNFAQGPMAMFATYVGLTQFTDHGVNFWFAALISVVVGMALSAATERVLVRPLYHRAEINPIVVMVGLFTLLEAVTQAIWSSNPRFPASPFSQNNFTMSNNTIGLSPFAVFEISVAFAAMIGVGLLFNYTKLGLQLRASALAPEVARLLGVRVNRLLTLGWAIAGGVGALSAVVVALTPTGLAYSMMDSVFILGFIAAAIGGLESPLGALLGGVVIGLLMQFINDFWSSNFSVMSGVVALIIVLMVRPEGLFTNNSKRRV